MKSLPISAPLTSMWTDGSQNDNTNFAEHSGLEGDHCCVKVGYSQLVQCVQCIYFDGNFKYRGN